MEGIDLSIYPLRSPRSPPPCSIIYLIHQSIIEPHFPVHSPNLEPILFSISISIHPSTCLPVYPSVSATPLSNQIIVEHRFLDRHVENCTLLRFSVLFHFDASGAMFFDAWVNYNDFTATSLGITGSNYMEFSFNGIHCDPKWL